MKSRKAYSVTSEIGRILAGLNAVDQIDVLDLLKEQMNTGAMRFSRNGKDERLKHLAYHFASSLERDYHLRSAQLNVALALSEIAKFAYIAKAARDIKRNAIVDGVHKEDKIGAIYEAQDNIKNGVTHQDVLARYRKEYIEREKEFNRQECQRDLRQKQISQHDGASQGVMAARMRLRRFSEHMKAMNEIDRGDDNVLLTIFALVIADHGDASKARAFYEGLHYEAKEKMPELVGLLMLLENMHERQSHPADRCGYSDTIVADMSRNAMMMSMQAPSPYNH